MYFSTQITFSPRNFYETRVTNSGQITNCATKKTGKIIQSLTVSLSKLINILISLNYLNDIDNYYKQYLMRSAAAIISVEKKTH